MPTTRSGIEGVTIQGVLLSSFWAVMFFAPCAFAENAYTNHAGNVVAGWPVKLTSTHVTMAEHATPSATEAVAIPGRDARPARPRSRGTRDPTNYQPPTTNYQLTTTYPLSIFPESERRRIAADFLLRQGSGGQVGQLRVPAAVKRAISGAEKAMERSRKRAEKGLCAKEESEAFCAKSEAALKSYLDKQVKEGTITPAERKALGR